MFMQRALSRAARPAASSARSMSAVTIEFPGAYATHRCEAPDAVAETSKEELLEYFKTMYTMRRMEITCDNEYKARTIRGFCHLYDGQEAIGTGINAALDLEDSWITSYRCHCIMLARGGTVEGVLAELMGNAHGETGGKGGSMHFYNKEQNFYGGQGIVGAQGQIWEAANMAALWKLPMIFCIENNQYGMGTSISRSSSNNDYYTMGNLIPGIKMDGMNVLSVREGMKHVKDYVGSGNGPMYVEMSTYRYHGHSMSDPGTTYRNRDEIAAMRSTRDPIEHVKKMLVDHTDATEEELKAMEKVIRKEAYIRMPDYTKSIRQ
ncbi:pyruvate dehydrogenase [Aureococcus anophagefferens]|nr:pyruvate dehydrogenase [Aureococcus anophagefferens]